MNKRLNFRKVSGKRGKNLKHFLPRACNACGECSVFSVCPSVDMVWEGGYFAGNMPLTAY